MRLFRLWPCLSGIIILTAAIPLLAQVNPINVELANLKADIDRLNQQVRLLRSEVEALSRENAELRRWAQDQLQANQGSYITLAQLNQTLQALEARIQAAAADSRQAIVRQVSGEVENLAKQTQAAINALAKSIEGVPRVQAPAQTTFSDQYPKNGTTYTVKSGDSIARIARQFNSRVEWIRNANRLAGDTIHPGQELFIPLQD